MIFDDQELAWLAIGLIRNVGVRTLRNIQTHFAGDLTRALSADAKTLQKVRGVGTKTASAIQAIDLEKIRRDVEGWQKQGVTILTLNSADYPRRLRVLDDAPPTLFTLGKYSQQMFDKSIAIVGTRQPDDLIQIMAMMYASDLVLQGFAIISGMALGIDKEVHLGSLIMTDVPASVAVLGNGVLKPYPPENHALAKALVLNGVLMSEVPPDASVNAPSLVARNRIISGLADKVIVMQSEVNGGAMHAARFAMAQGRTVYTIDQPFSGNQQLIRQGAVALPLYDKDKAMELILND